VVDGGGPFIESTHGKLGFTAPLTGITAAVVGVIANLAVLFAWHVLWPHGFNGRFDGISALSAWPWPCSASRRRSCR
jgi:chromate transporter